MQNKKTKFIIQNSRLRQCFGGQTGFVLPLTLIVVSIIVTISATVAIVIGGELEFSALSRESQKSFFAADAGSECAIYWDIKEYAFSSSSPTAINCLSFSGTPTANGDNTYFTFSMNLNNGSCVDVVVDKRSPPATAIESFGYNYASVSGGTCQSTDSRLVERALRVRY